MRWSSAYDPDLPPSHVVWGLANPRQDRWSFNGWIDPSRRPQVASVRVPSTAQG
jgi:hypothetical protein